MIIMEGEQNTPEWHQLRLAIPTASGADRIVTASGGISSQSDQYLNEKIAEWICGIPYGDFNGNAHTERGHEFEPMAISGYEFMTDCNVETPAFIYRDKEKLCGCSPDGLVKRRWGIEAKCPIETIFLSYVAAGVCPKKYLPQVHASMWITDLDRWDFVAYHANWEPFIITVERDGKWDKVIDKGFNLFIEMMLEKRETPKFIEMRNRRLEKS